MPAANMNTNANPNSNLDQSIIGEIGEIHAYASAARARGESIGLVPTMGALHEGHLSLIRRAAAENDTVIVSVFVNPIQFDDESDLSAYPAALDADTQAALSAGADKVFAPSAQEMYPEGFSTFIDMTGVTERLCGASRPNHFRGVLTVVGKLFNICMPDRAYFGEKDAQQLAVVRKMVSDLCVNVEIIGCPTVREADGLAMSSRNFRLSAAERTAARALNRALTAAKALFDAGQTDPAALIAAAREQIAAEPRARIDYIELVDSVNFEAVSVAKKDDLIALAVFIGDTRLIDNSKL